MFERLRTDPVWRGRVVVAAVALVALAVRLWAVLGWSRALEPTGDEAFYWRQAGYLSDGYGFVLRNNAAELVPTAAHPPAYSAVLGVVGLLPGTDGHLPFRLATLLLGVAAAVVVAVVAMRLAGWRAGLVAGLLAAVQPNLWFNDAKLTAESLFALTIGLVLLATYDYVARPGVRQVVVLAAAVGLASLTRAEALFLYPLLIVPLLVRTHGVPSRRRWAQAGWAALALGVVCGPWVLRNLVAFDRRATISSGSGFVIEISNCDQTFGLAPPVGDDGQPQPGKDADTFLGYWARDCDRSDATVHGADAVPWPVGDETVAEAEKRRIGLDYARAHLDRLPVVLAARIGRIWDVWRPAQSTELNVFFETRTATTELVGHAVRWQDVALWLHLVTLPLAVVGGVVLWRRKVTVIPFVALAVSATLTAAVSFGITRYRVGADVGLIVLAGVAVGAGWEHLARRRRGGEAPDGPGVGEAAVAP